MAIGNPFGLDHTVTVGILSAKGRSNFGGEQIAGPYDDFLQTDASINPGNSGGPLIDMKGRVIGINTAIAANGQGIGFAIPIDMAKSLLPQLLENGSVTRGWLGVQIQRVTPALAKTFKLERLEGRAGRPGVRRQPGLEGQARARRRDHRSSTASRSATTTTCRASSRRRRRAPRSTSRSCATARRRSSRRRSRR